MRCDCSICARKGSVLTTNLIAPDAMEVQVRGHVQKTYQFGTMTARHHFCGVCGIHTFVETRLNPGFYRINLGCVEEVDALKLSEDIYDGKSL